MKKYCICLNTGNIGDTNFNKGFLYNWTSDVNVQVSWLNNQRDGKLRMDEFLNHFKPISEATARQLFPYNFS
jgi:hypothetical protein